MVSVKRATYIARVELGCNLGLWRILGLGWRLRCLKTGGDDALWYKPPAVSAVAANFSSKFKLCSPWKDTMAKEILVMELGAPGRYL